MRYSIIWPTYAKQWNRMTIKANRVNEFTGYAKQLLAHKDRYVSVEKQTGVPWWLIAVLHLRESNANFGTYLGNGQSLKRRTTIVPKGRGPFSEPNAFEKGAVDALRLDGLINVKDWRIEKALFWTETFNGWGYANMRPSMPSPYVFGGTNIQQPGKFIADHVFSKRVMDPQPGTAPILQMLAKLDSTITFVRES
jgi:lysozyme family protein